MCVYMHIHTYTHTHTHTYIHTYIHTYVHKQTAFMDLWICFALWHCNECRIVTRCNRTDIL